MTSRLARRVFLAIAALALTSACTAIVAGRTPSPGFAISVSPGRVSTAQGGTNAAFAVTITRRHLTAPIAFTVSGLPASTTATFIPASTTGITTMLSVATSAGTPLGAYTLTVKGTSGALTASSAAYLTVSAAEHKPFGISGVLDRPLSPGATGYVNLALRNPNDQALRVTNLVVSITGRGNSACVVRGNFTTAQYGGDYPLSIPANSTRTLSQLGVAQSAWPAITMNDSASNQDICKSTSLALSYTGSGIGQ